ncbi:hypothetical protein [Methyloceanibacter sp.]
MFAASYKSYIRCFFAAPKIDRLIIDGVDMSNLTWGQADANA